jgi:hypothetical protein
MVDALEIQLPAAPPLAHFAESIDVVAWRRKPVAE